MKVSQTRAFHPRSRSDEGLLADSIPFTAVIFSRFATELTGAPVYAIEAIMPILCLTERLDPEHGSSAYLWGICDRSGNPRDSKSETKCLPMSSPLRIDVSGKVCAIEQSIGDSQELAVCRNTQCRCRLIPPGSSRTAPRREPLYDCVSANSCSEPVLLTSSVVGSRTDPQPRQFNMGRSDALALDQPQSADFH